MVVLSACVQTLDRSIVEPALSGTLDQRSRLLKAHMLDGHVYVLSEWQVDPEEVSVSGRGTHFDANRKVLAEGAFTIPLDSVALFETNVVTTSPVVAALAIPLVPAAMIAALCISDPKSCFGSCPTFYVWDGERSLLQAEGFSDSIAPVLEASDIDALYRYQPQGRQLHVRMTNEALETHVVRSVQVVAARRPNEGRVFATPEGAFVQATEMTPPAEAQAKEGSCLDLLLQFDGAERYSRTHESDLATREIIDLEFTSVPGGDLGLVIASRQTLLTTYLFYQSLAYMGSSAGRWLAALERGDEQTLRRSKAVGDLLGKIEVLIQDESGEWLSVGEVGEVGPIATEVHVVRLGDLPGSQDRRPLRVRLRLTQGLWRIDYVALAKLGASVEPLRLDPSRVLYQGLPDSAARDRLLDPAKTLVTLRGDAYTLVYDLPEDFRAYEIFLDSQGYYIEWMREEWLAEESPLQAAAMLLRPSQALRTLAPEFKITELRMEDVFWRSRYVHP
jgi:hypothetical protein